MEQGDVVIDGVINDSFSIDEYEGYLRVVTTIRENDDTSGGVNPLLRIDGATACNPASREQIRQMPFMF